MNKKSEIMLKLAYNIVQSNRPTQVINNPDFTKLLSRGANSALALTYSGDIAKGINTVGKGLSWAATKAPWPIGSVATNAISSIGKTLNKPILGTAAKAAGTAAKAGRLANIVGKIGTGANVAGWALNDALAIYGGMKGFFNPSEQAKREAEKFINRYKNKGALSFATNMAGNMLINPEETSEAVGSFYRSTYDALRNAGYFTPINRTFRSIGDTASSTANTLGNYLYNASGLGLASKGLKWLGNKVIDLGAYL